MREVVAIPSPFIYIHTFTDSHILNPFSYYLQNATKMPIKSNLSANFEKKLQKSAFFFKNICTIQK